MGNHLFRVSVIIHILVKMLTSTDFTGNTSQNSMLTLKSPLPNDTTKDHGTPHLTTEIRHQWQICDPCVLYNLFLLNTQNSFYVSNRLFQNKYLFPWKKRFIVGVQGWLKVEIYDTYLINQMRTRDMVLAYMASLQITLPAFKYLFIREEQKYKLKQKKSSEMGLFIS